MQYTTVRFCQLLRSSPTLIKINTRPIKDENEDDKFQKSPLVIFPEATRVVVVVVVVVGFALIRAAVMCLRGCRSKYAYHQTSNILLATAESGLS